MALRRTAVRLIALDIDGTLLDPEGTLRPAVRDAVRHAAALGVHVALVTGRRWAATRPVVDALGVPVSVLACQGALGVAADGRLLWREGIPLAAAGTVLDRARQLGLHPFVYLHYRRRGQVVEELIYEGEVDRTAWLWFPEGDPHVRQVEGALRLRTRPLRISLLAEPERARRFRADLVERTGGRISLFATDDLHEGHLVVEVLPPRVDKGRALARLAQRLGIPRRAVLAVGDYHNDTPMIAWAGIGVAMAHAPQEVQAAADWVTASNAEDGVARVLERFVLDRAGVAATG